MDEYASLRKIEFELCGKNLPEKYKAFVRRVLNDRNIIPAADVAPVVRCKDCKFHEDEEIGMVYCPNTIGGWIGEDWFCADGERKDGTDSDTNGSI